MFANDISHQEADDAAQAGHTAVDVELGANISNTMQARPLTEVARPLLWMVLRLLHRTDAILASARVSGVRAEKMTDAEALWALGRKSTIRIQGIITITDVIVFLW